MKLKYLFILLIIFLFVGLLYLINIGNSVNENIPHLSKSISESRDIGAFVTEYKFESFTSILKDTSSLSPFLSEIDFAEQEYWVEKQWAIKYNFIFFKKYIFSDIMRLHITDPTSLMGDNPGPPFIIFELKEQQKSSHSHGKGGEVSIIYLDTLKPIISLEVYLQDNNTPITYAGNILLKKT